MSLSPIWKRVAPAWILLVGGYAALNLILHRGPELTSTANLAQCVVPLFANFGLLWNASSPYKRRNNFWMLLALGCTLWLVAQLMWTYSEVVLHQRPEQVSGPEFIFFLHTIPWIAALVLRPHQRKVGETLRYGYLDLMLLALWWVYLYLFVVTPWKSVFPDPGLYSLRLMQIYLTEQLVFLSGLGYLFITARGKWRVIYGHLLGAAFLYSFGSVLNDRALASGNYYTGSLVDLPLVAAFVWFGTAGLEAQRLAPAPEPPTRSRRSSTQWIAVLSRIVVLSMPGLAAWQAFFASAPMAVREFRVLLTLGVLVAGTALVFLRQHLVNRDRMNLFTQSEETRVSLERLQTQFVQSEKLAALGQLAAGAAHEINNPLTVVLGYTELLLENNSASTRVHTLAEKIREQARRTKTLVQHLLSFARQMPAEKTLLDVNAIAASAVQLRSLDLRDKKIRINMESETVLPSVRGDPNQLLQVFYNIISNAVEAMEPGGGTLTIRTLRERGAAVIEFSDSGPGIADPNLVFDPFYTTKPVGKGTGLGLSICYGIIREHGGQISCFNRVEGGATFRIELPAVLSLFPKVGAATSPAAKTA